MRIEDYNFILIITLIINSMISSLDGGVNLMLFYFKITEILVNIQIESQTPMPKSSKYIKI